MHPGSSSSTPAHRPCVVVPVYNHGGALARLVDALRPLGLTCWLVDDGSDAECAAAIVAAARANPDWLRCMRQTPNQGKGAAVMAGLRAALADGFTHAIQIDADLQHDPADIPRFVAASRAAPAAIISGAPRFDASIPAARYYGRWLTHVLVWVETLSLEIRDSMCGFRLYPLAPAVALDERAPFGRRMQFDTDAIVRLHWRGVPVVNLDTPVTYPVDGVSHFAMVADNLRMIRLHLRLLAGMLLRSPRLLARTLRRARFPGSIDARA
ncbi:MAG: glycosyltransferase family 2 protein [Burkholderiaceae bacterium]